VLKKLFPIRPAMRASDAFVSSAWGAIILVFIGILIIVTGIERGTGGVNGNSIEISYFVSSSTRLNAPKEPLKLAVSCTKRVILIPA
jgi:hypothetical protein